MENIIINKRDEFVEQLIPQKHPFKMVNLIFDYSDTHINTGFETNKAIYFTHQNEFLESGLIEHMAQSVALHTGYKYFLLNLPAPTGYIGSIKNITINRLPKINEVIKTNVKIIQEFGDITLVEIESKIDDELISFGEMKTVIAS